MLIKKPEKGLLATPLKWLGYLGMATMLIVMAYHGIRVFDQIKEDQDMETVNVDINSKGDRESGNDENPVINFIDLIHTDDLDVISFIAFQRRFDLNLTPMKHQIISDKAHILRSDTFGVDRYFNESNTFKKCEFYHGVGLGMSAAISHCEHRGFWGRITTKEGVYDIERIDGDRHRIISVDLEDEVGEFRTNGADEFIIPRRSLGAAPVDPPAVRFPECAKIEMLLIYMPSIQSKYANDPNKLDEDALATLLEAQILYHETDYIKDGVEFICFDLVLSATLSAKTGECWTSNYVHEEVPRECWSNDAGIKAHDITQAEVYHYVKGHMHLNTWTVDATYGIRDMGGGLGTSANPGSPSGICSGSRTASVGGMNARTLAHELGHNLGLNHDQDAVCGKHGGDFGFVFAFYLPTLFHLHLLSLLCM